MPRIGDYVDPQTIEGGIIIPGENSGTHGWQRVAPVPQGYTCVQLPDGELVILDKNNVIVSIEQQ